METKTTQCEQIFDTILSVKRGDMTETEYQAAIQQAATEHQEAHGCGGDYTESPAPNEPLTLDTANELVSAYLMERGYNGREVRLHKRFTLFDDEAKSQPFEINWSACGAQSLTDAETFANAILIAKTLAETLTVNA
jgi:hypothetical protein